MKTFARQQPKCLFHLDSSKIYCWRPIFDTVWKENVLLKSVLGTVPLRITSFATSGHQVLVLGSETVFWSVHGPWPKLDKQKTSKNVPFVQQSLGLHSWPCICKIYFYEEGSSLVDHTSQFLRFNIYYVCCRLLATGWRSSCFASIDGCLQLNNYHFLPPARDRLQSNLSKYWWGKLLSVFSCKCSPIIKYSPVLRWHFLSLNMLMTRSLPRPCLGHLWLPEGSVGATSTDTFSYYTKLNEPLQLMMAFFLPSLQWCSPKLSYFTLISTI